MQGMYPNLSIEEIKIEIGQTMAFIVLAFGELIHVFNIRSNRESIFKTGIFNNKMLLLAIGTSSLLMFLVLLIPGLQSLFGIIALPVDKILECILLMFMPIIIVEIMKLIKLNASKDEE